MSVTQYIYLYARHWDDEELCRLEMRAFFNKDSMTNVLMSELAIDPSRSTFIKGRLDVLFQANNWSSFVDLAKQFQFDGETFKVTSLNHSKWNTTTKMELSERRTLEKEIGLQIVGEPDLDHPDRQFYFINIDDTWYFGTYIESKAVSLQHKNKPHSYSTALSTVLARTVANIAAPFPDGVTVIDPCCGIGNVLVEALAMDFDIVGSDINWLVVKHTRENIAFFGYDCDVTTRPIAAITEQYDVAIIDMPYNIFTSASPEQQYAILVEARRISKKAVIVSIASIDNILKEVGFTIVDQCEAKKSTFVRQIYVCN